MKTSRALPLAFSTLTTLCFMFPSLAAPIEFYVAINGNDNNGGSIHAPFASLEKARDSIRAIKASTGLPPDGVTVWLREGAYERTNTFNLINLDSGSTTSPILYRAMTGETVRLHGAKPLNPSWFSPVPKRSPAWARLDEKARGHVMQVDLRAHGITHFGTLKPRGFGSSSTIAGMELFFTNSPMPLARWPDVGENGAARRQTPTDITLQLYGTPSPDVAGVYSASGTNDGVNTYRRASPVGGKQYHLYRRTWTQADAQILTAWFLTSQPSGYPSSHSGPFWYSYTKDLAQLEPAQGATGTVFLIDPVSIENGFVRVAAIAPSNSFHYTQARPGRWVQAEEPWFHGYWKYPWADFHLKALSVDTQNKRITLAGAPEFGFDNATPYYALNLLEEITAPGEWYLNRHSGILYFWPPSSLRHQDISVSSLETPLVQLSDTHDVTFRNITFEMTRGDLVNISSGARNTFEHCVLRNAGNYAAKISGASNGLLQCIIRDTGDGGVLLSGGDRASLTSSGNYVKHCLLTRFGRWSWTYTPGVRTDYGCVGAVISHNLFYDAPHTAILLAGQGNNHLVEFNIIHDVCKWASDAGAIYLGRDLGARGTVIRYNFIYNIASTFTGCGTQGIYLDDCISGIRVHGNILYNISHFGVQNGGGRDNIIENNIMARCGGALVADARGLGWMMNSGGSASAWRELQKLPYQSTVWSNAFPECAAIPTNWTTVTNERWMASANCVFSRNIAFSNTVFVSGNDNCFMDYREITNNLPDSDPLFVDEGTLDLTLREDSPAYSIPGFNPIPFKQIGPGRRLHPWN
jgi:hypothetical protein